MYNLILKFADKSTDVVDKMREMNEARGEDIPNKYLLPLRLAKVFPEALKVSAENDEEYELLKKQVVDSLISDKMIYDFFPTFVESEMRYIDAHFYKLITERLYSYCNPEVRRIALTLI